MMGDLSTILESSEPQLIATNLGATEGPLWHRAGYLTLVDMQSSRLLRWDTTGGVQVVREQTGEGNGCTLDLQGRLVMCEGAHRRVTRMEPDGTITTLADRWQGKRLNRPNDVICRSDGSLFFTDPELRVPTAEREVGFSGVYRISPQGDLSVASDECEYPNGLAFSPDEPHSMWPSVVSMNAVSLKRAMASFVVTAASAPSMWMRKGGCRITVCLSTCRRRSRECRMG
jgi:gluconolactonase